MTSISSIDEPGRLVDTIASHMSCSSKKNRICWNCRLYRLALSISWR